MRKIVLAVAVLVASAVPAAADLVIQSSPGGRIVEFLQLFQQVREDGRRVIIDGPCFSACTLVVSMVPRNRICVTQRAALGFHAAWHPGEDGRARTHPRATQLMMETYPAGVRKWIRRHGGLTSRTIVLRGRALRAMYRACQ